jgi:N-acetylmuramoyl-L-alanine amidase
LRRSVKVGRETLESVEALSTLNPPRIHAATLIAVIAIGAAASLLAQSPQPTQLPPLPPSQSGMNHNLVFLDPAHGGPDSGANFGNNLAEKEVTLQLTARLRSALVSEGFTVVTSRDADPPVALPNDQRAEDANRTRAVACIVVHATASGFGLHLYTSALRPTDPAEPSPGTHKTFVPTVWDEAQAPSVRQSLHLRDDVARAASGAGLQVASGHATISPLDNLVCPAIAIELAPLRASGGGTTPLSDGAYQQRVAETIARSLLFWRSHAEPPPPHAVPTADDWIKAIPTAPAKSAPPVKPPIRPSAGSANPIAAPSQRQQPNTGRSLGSDVLDGAGDPPPRTTH